MMTVYGTDLFGILDLLTSAECRTLIERGETMGFEQAAVRTAHGAELRTAIRNNDRAEFTDPALAADLWARCAADVPTEFDGGMAVGLDEHFRFYRYDVGQQFRPHRDGVEARSPHERTRLTCLFYLNGDFEGGETVFHPYGPRNVPLGEPIAVVPQTGAALLFRHEWVHEGRPVTTGRKYVLRSDVFYRFPT